MTQVTDTGAATPLDEPPEYVVMSGRSLPVIDTRWSEKVREAYLQEYFGECSLDRLRAITGLGNGRVEDGS